VGWRNIAGLAGYELRGLIFRSYGTVFYYSLFPESYDSGYNISCLRQFNDK
jgi:hypothetical protein